MYRISTLLLRIFFVTSLVAWMPTCVQASVGSSKTLSRTFRGPTTRRKRPLTAFLSSSHHDNDHDSVWCELRPPYTKYDIDPSWSSSPRKPPRKGIWYGRYDDERTWVPAIGANESTSPHPLRSKEYTLQLRWTGKLDRGLPDRLQIEFDVETGMCRATTHDDIVALGHWQLSPSGLMFTLIDASGAVEYTCTAQVHLNPFGDSAKLLQGSIVRYDWDDGTGIQDPVQDEVFVPIQRKWFRPVVGKFSGKGMET